MRALVFAVHDAHERRRRRMKSRVRDFSSHRLHDGVRRLPPFGHQSQSRRRAHTKRCFSSRALRHDSFRHVDQRLDRRRRRLGVAAVALQSRFDRAKRLVSQRLAAARERRSREREHVHARARGAGVDDDGVARFRRARALKADDIGERAERDERDDEDGEGDDEGELAERSRARVLRGLGVRLRAGKRHRDAM